MAIAHPSPVNFTWKKETGLDTENVYSGLLAQDVMKFIPEAIGKDSDGNYSISDRVLIITLINAVKDQQQQIDLLNEKLGLQKYDKSLIINIGEYGIIKPSLNK